MAGICMMSSIISGIGRWDPETGLDAELMQFDMPLGSQGAFTGSLEAEGGATEQSPHHHAVGDGILHRPCIDRCRAD